MEQPTAFATAAEDRMRSNETLPQFYPVFIDQMHTAKQ